VNSLVRYQEFDVGFVSVIMNVWLGEINDFFNNNDFYWPNFNNGKFDYIFYLEIRNNLFIFI
jgi:hypothetical protein